MASEADRRDRGPDESLEDLAVVRSEKASTAQKLFDPANSPGGLVVVRLSWTGNLWTVDVLEGDAPQRPR
jgi:hypothetical protein